MLALSTSFLLLSVNPEAAPAPTPGPPSTALAGSQTASKPSTPQTPPKPKSDGRGLLITSGVFGGVALGLSVGHAALFQRSCDSFHYADGCFGDGTPHILAFLFATPALALTGTGIGLGLAGARRRGRAWSGARTASRRRDVAIGATLLGTGIALRVLSIGFVTPALRVDSDAVYDGEIDGERVRRLHTTGIVVGQLGDTLAATGGGLLVYRGRSKVEVAISTGGLQLRF